MKRSMVAAILPLLAGGCLPLPITIASTTFAGISYMTSGKSTTDHVLSATMEKDCALTRPIIGEPFCRDIGPNGEGRTDAVTVAYYPGDRDEVLSNDERETRWHRGALNLDKIVAESRELAAAPQYLTSPPRVTIAGVIITKDQIVAAPEARALPVAVALGWGTLAPSTSIDLTPVAALPPARSLTAAPTAPQAGADRWVVLGSFQDLDRADVMAARYAARHPTILPTRVNGGQWHRVAVGPLTQAEARSLRDDLGKVDGRNPWVVRLRDN